MKRVKTLSGFRDFLPEEALKRNWLKGKLRKIFEQWGYDPVETPTLEALALFEGQIGEDEKLFYKFKDLGGRNVALRYDQTVPICRLIGQYAQELPLPFKRYQIQPAFRAEKPQKGRYREFLQADADIFGIESPVADAQVIALSLDIYRQLGFKKAIALINDRKLLKDIPYPALVAIDKLKKIGREAVLKEMEKKGILLKRAKEYLSYIKNLKPNETINIILDYLKAYGIDKSWYAFEPTIVRSFAYSTGPIWEVEIPGFEAGSVLGGERFDKLVKDIAGINIPGTGFGLGFDRTLEAAEQFGLAPKVKTTTQILVTIFSPEFLNESLKLANKLREKNINTEVYPDPDKKLDKQLKYADRKGIPYVAILGREEIKAGKVTLKEMKTGKQKKLTFEKTAKCLISTYF